MEKSTRKHYTNFLRIFMAMHSLHLLKEKAVQGHAWWCPKGTWHFKKDKQLWTQFTDHKYNFC